LSDPKISEDSSELIILTSLLIHVNSCCLTDCTYVHVVVDALQIHDADDD